MSKGRWVTSFFLSPEISVKPILSVLQNWKGSRPVAHYEEENKDVLWKPQWRLMAKWSTAVLISVAN